MENHTFPPTLLTTASAPHYTETAVLVLYIATVCSFIVIGTVGNILVLLSVWSFSRLRSWANALIVNLSVADLIVAMVTMPTLVVRSLVADAMGSFPKLCRLVFQVNLAVVLVSVSTLGVSSVNRYILITKPRYVYRQYCGKNSVVGMLAAIWAVSIVVVFVPPLWMDLISYVPANQFCHFREGSAVAWLYGSLLLLLYVVAVIGVIIVSSVSTFLKIASSRNRVQMERSQTGSQLGGGGGHQGNRMSKQEFLVTRMMLFVCLAFCLSMLPYCINHALSYRVYRYPLFLKISILLLLINSCINPLIYAGSNRFFRASFKKILTCKWACTQ